MSWLQIKIWIEMRIHWETSTLKNIDIFGMAKVQSALRPLSEHIFTARCTLLQSAVLRSHVVCLSVCLSVRLSVCDVGEL